MVNTQDDETEALGRGASPGRVDSDDQARDWEDPAVFGRGKEAPRASLTPYDNPIAAKIGRPYASRRVQLLNGDWQFRLFPQPDAVPADFMRPDFDSGDWRRLMVPGHWQLQGEGTPVYTNLAYPFEPTPPQVPTENETGCYRHFIELPEAWAEDELFLVFEGVDSAFHLWVNGQSVGYSQVSRCTAEFRVTDYVHPGRNLVAVKVYRWSDGSYLEDQDMWWLSGIFRDVFICAEPSVCVRDVQTRVEFSPNYRVAELSVSVDLHNYHAEGVSEDFSTTLFDPHNHLLDQVEQTIDLDGAAAVNVAFSILVPKPYLWTAETPNSYVLLLRIGSTYYSLRVGLRQVELIGGELRVNGHSVLLRGINLHDFHPAGGRTLCEADMIRDLTLLRDHNINAIRCSHYPKLPRFYELCDAWGFYVIDEADLETHGLGDQLTKDPAWRDAYVDRAERLVRRDRNHACVIAWSLGNESGSGANIRAMAERVRELDADRPINYYQAGSADYVDWIGMHYPRLDQIQQLVDEDPSGRPILLEEYAHAAGNAVGNLREYWELIERTPRLIGGFIWEWCDQALYRQDAEGKQVYAYGGDFGDEPNDSVYCLDGVVFPDRRPHPALQEIKKVFQPAALKWNHRQGKLVIFNRRFHTELSDLSGRWRLSCDGAAIDSGAFELPRISPGGKGAVQLTFPPVEAAGEVVLTVSLYTRAAMPWTTTQLEVAWEQFILPGAAELPAPELPALSDAVWDFQQVDAPCLSSGSNPLILANPQLILWRAPLQNDASFQGAWRQAGLDTLRAAEQTYRQTGEAETIETAWESAAGKSLAEDCLVVALNDSGGADLQHEFRPLTDLPTLPRLGLRLRLNPGFERVLWFGRGPHENLCDRCCGAKLHQYEAAVEELSEPYIVPQENGQRCEVRWLELRGPNLPRLRFIPHSPCTFTARRHTVEDLDAAEHQEDLCPGDFIELCIDHKHAGTGNTSLRAERLAVYQVASRRTRWQLAILPLDNSVTEKV